MEGIVRKGYPSDVTDEEWDFVSPYLLLSREDSRSLQRSLRELFNGVRSIVPPVITWPTPSTITYGTPLSSAQLNASANVAGTFTYSPASDILQAGTHTLTATFTPSDTAGYQSVTTAVSLIVNKVAPIITWPTVGNITSGTPLSSMQLDASSSIQPGTFVYSPAADTVLPVEPNLLSVTFIPSDTTDYNTATATANLTVNPPTSSVWDTGTVTLSINGTNVASTNYGEGSTPSSVAEGLAAGLVTGSPVNVTAVNDTVYIEATQAGAGTDYSYALQATSSNPTHFSQPSFAGMPGSGHLDAGTSTNISGGVIYSFTTPAGSAYDGYGNLMNFTDSVMGTWAFQYDTLNRLPTGTPSSGTYLGQYACWAYDSFGNRTAQSYQTTNCTSPASLTPTARFDTNNHVTWVSKSRHRVGI